MPRLITCAAVTTVVFTFAGLSVSSSASAETARPTATATKQFTPEQSETATTFDIPVTEIPVDASDGVTLGSDANAITVGVPEAQEVGDGQVASDGSVTYDATDATSDKVVPGAGSVQFLKELHDESAPTEYTYPVDVPEGGRIELTGEGPNGIQQGRFGALVFNGLGKVVATVDTPWAKDADGKQVATHFSTDGQSLTQHVLHRDASVRHPVTADPYFRRYAMGVVVTFSHDDMVATAATGVGAATALIGASATTIVGPVALTPLLAPVVVSASWAVAVRHCYWFWFPYPWIGKKWDWGYYKC